MSCIKAVQGNSRALAPETRTRKFIPAKKIGAVTRKNPGATRHPADGGGGLAGPAPPPEGLGAPPGGGETRPLHPSTPPGQKKTPASGVGLSFTRQRGLPPQR